MTMRDSDCLHMGLREKKDIPKDEVQIYDFDSNGKVIEMERDSSKLQALLTR